MEGARSMTRVRHQIPNVERYVDEWDSRVRCAWSDCENPGSGLHYVIECFANQRTSNHPELPRRIECSECRKAAFCSEQHRSYYARSHRPADFGSLAPGVNARFL
jgi:hypothetical protein